MKKIVVPNFEVDMIPAGTGIRTGRPLKPEGIAVHWTANTSRTADAKAHRSYWGRAKYGTHYVADDKRVIQCVPDNEVLWHVGDQNRYFKGPTIPRGNFKFIGIEMCVNEGSNFQSTFDLTVALVASKCLEYGWSVANVYRHYDVTGKDCPRMMSPFVPNGDREWAKFKAAVNRYLDEVRNPSSTTDNTAVQGGENVMTRPTYNPSEKDKQFGKEAIQKLADLGHISSPEVHIANLDNEVSNSAIWQWVVLSRVAEGKK